MRAIGLLAALWLSITTAVASAQEDSPLVPVRAFMAWSVQVNEVSTETLALMDQIFVADEHGVSVREGLITPEEGERRIDAWRTEMDAELAGLEARAEVLAAGPELVPAGKEKLAETLADNLGASLELVAEILTLAESAARQDIAGKEVDDSDIFAARYAVLQAFYAGQVATLEAAVETVDPRHPQGPLVIATRINMESTIIALELGRMSFGGAPSEHAVENPQAVLDANQRRVEQEIARATGMLASMQREFARVPRETPEIARMIQSVEAMLATYPQSFVVERNGAAIFDGLEARIAEGGQEATFQFADELTLYEMERDSLNTERLRLASQI